MVDAQAAMGSVDEAMRLASEQQRRYKGLKAGFRPVSVPRSMFGDDEWLKTDDLKLIDTVLPYPWAAGEERRRQRPFDDGRGS